MVRIPTENHRIVSDKKIPIGNKKTFNFNLLYKGVHMSIYSSMFIYGSLINIWFLIKVIWDLSNLDRIFILTTLNKCSYIILLWLEEYQGLLPSDFKTREGELSFIKKKKLIFFFFPNTLSKHIEPLKIK